MTTAFQIGGFQFDAFQEEGGGGGSYRPVIDAWGLRHWLELRARRVRENDARLRREREEQERQERELLAEPVLVLAEQPRTVLKLRPSLLDIDAELEEFGALLMKIAAEVDPL